MFTLLLLGFRLDREQPSLTLMDRMTEMTLTNLGTRLSALSGATVSVSKSGAYPEPEAASVLLLFSEGSWIRADYWRVVKSGKAGVSSFDHDQKYGLPAQIDAFQYLKQELSGRHLTQASFEPRTCDLFFSFDGDLELQVFSFTGYEVWEIHFPNGTCEYSNHAV
jgi:hypothetical protein